jgi:sugar fermentation stimulation protein A
MVRGADGWVGINTSLANGLVREALENSLFPELGPFDRIRAEVKTGASRLDFLLHNGRELTYLEVKNCTLAANGIAMFPDAVTARGTRHLEELLRLTKEGHRAALIFCVQMAGVTSFTAAAAIDPLYAETLARVVGQGVSALAGRAEVTPTGINLTERLPVVV